MPVFTFYFYFFLFILLFEKRKKLSLFRFMVRKRLNAIVENIYINFASLSFHCYRYWINQCGSGSETHYLKNFKKFKKISDPVLSDQDPAFYLNADLDLEASLILRYISS
jgi:hypothetical protein